jgi:hypothetical protein
VLAGGFLADFVTGVRKIQRRAPHLLPLDRQRLAVAHERGAAPYGSNILDQVHGC